MISKKQKNKNRYKTIRYFERYCNIEKECQICHAKEKVQIHHIDYEDYLKINLLCIKHHNQVHKREIEAPEIIDLEKLTVKPPYLYKHVKFVETKIEEIKDHILNKGATMNDMVKAYHTSPKSIQKFLSFKEFEELKKKSKENAQIRRLNARYESLTNKKHSDKMQSKRKENEYMEKVPMQIRMPLKLKEKLDEISKTKGLTINAIIVQALWNLET